MFLHFLLIIVKIQQQLEAALMTKIKFIAEIMINLAYNTMVPLPDYWVSYCMPNLS